jgi:hypothetical protein
LEEGRQEDVNEDVNEDVSKNGSEATWACMLWRMESSQGRTRREDARPWLLKVKPTREGTKGGR